MPTSIFTLKLLEADGRVFEMLLSDCTDLYIPSGGTGKIACGNLTFMEYRFILSNCWVACSWKNLYKPKSITLFKLARDEN